MVDIEYVEIFQRHHQRVQRQPQAPVRSKIHLYKYSSLSLFFLYFLATTTQDPQLAYIPDGSLTDNTWTMKTYSYMAVTSTNLTLQFFFQTDNKHDWFVDDISVKDPTSVEMLTNGDFESNPSLTGWASGSCSSIATSSAEFHSPNRSCWVPCNGPGPWISQSFSAIGGQVYNVTFWLYLHLTGSGGGSGSNPLYVFLS
jgi:hypothetical protein